MSHIVTIKTEVRDPAAVAAACRRLGLPEPVHGTATALRGRGHRAARPAARLALPRRHRHRHRRGPLRQLQRAPGATRAQLDRFLQAYAVEKARDRGPQEGPPRHRAGPGRRLDQADHPASEVAREDHRDHRRPQGRRPRSRPRASPAASAARPAGSSSRPSGRATAETLTAEFYQGQAGRPGPQAVQLIARSALPPHPLPDPPPHNRRRPP